MYKICKLWWLNNKCRCKESTNNNKWSLIRNNNNNYNNKKNKRIKLYPKNLVTSQVLQLNARNIKIKLSFLKTKVTNSVKNVLLRLIQIIKMNLKTLELMTQTLNHKLKICSNNSKILLINMEINKITWIIKIYLSNNKYSFYKPSFQIFYNHCQIK